MIIAPKITLVDLDNTLFDAVEFKKALFPQLTSFINSNRQSKIVSGDLEEIYESHIKSKGILSFAEFSNYLSRRFGSSQRELLNQIHSIELNKFLMPGAIDFSSNLVKDADWLIVYTAGALRTQRQKIERTDLNLSLNSPEVHHLGLIKQNNYSLLKEGLSKISRGEKLPPVVLVDTHKLLLEELITLLSEVKPDLSLVEDSPEIIERGIKIAHYLKVPLLPIWVKYGRYALDRETIVGAVTVPGLINKQNEVLRIKRETKLFQNPPAFRK